MTFDLQPNLSGQLTKLRPLAQEDYQGLYAVAVDPLIWAQHPAKNRREEQTFRTFFAESLASRAALTILDAADDRIIGSSRYWGYDEETGEVEIGWTFLSRSCWGGSFNREIKRLMLQHAFRFVSNVIFLVGYESIGSQRAVEKIGGIRIGSRPDDTGESSFIYRITAAAFTG